MTDVDDLKGPEVVARIKKAGGEASFLASRRHQRGALDRGRGRGHEALRPARRAGLERRHRHCRAVDHRDVAGGLAAADRDQSRRRVPVGEALPAGDAQDRRRLRHHDVVAGGPARRGRPFRLLRDQGRRAAVCQSDRDGMRHVRRRHPRQLGASRHHRHADLGQDPDGGRGRRAERADRSRGARENGDAAGACRRRPRRSRRACCIWRPMLRAT